MEPMKSIRSLVMNCLHGCLLGLGLALSGGCVSTPSSASEELRLAMTAGGMVFFEGKACDPATLPGALTSRGIAVDTPILVAIPADTPTGTLKELGRRLSSAGYRRFAFVRPKHADAVPAPVRVVR
jgi:hypothetical protein